MFHPKICDLQYFQEMHDRRYHPDIHGKPLMVRVAHLHQHLVKYSSSDVKRNQTYPDALACIFSIANALNLNITYGYMQLEENIDTLDDFTKIYHDDRLVEQYRIEMGKLAKLLEGFDHVESLDYRKLVCTALLRVLSILIQLNQMDGNTPTSLGRDYLKTIFKIKARNIFYCHYHTEDYNTPVYRSLHLLAESM